jgi:hypothetical protein
VRARRPAPEAPPVARDPARAVGLIGLVRLALGFELFLEAALRLGQPRLARARDRLRLLGTAIVEPAAGLAVPASAALVFRPAARHLRRLLDGLLGSHPLGLALALCLRKPPPATLARAQLLGQLVAARLAVELVLGLVGRLRLGDDLTRDPLVV